MLIASFHLNEADIQTLKLNDKIRIDNSWWNINKVIDYNANDEALTKVELISIDTEIDLANFPIKRPRYIGDEQSYISSETAVLSIKQQSNINLSVGNVEIYGKGNVVPSGLKGLVIGDNQSVTQDGLTTPNLTVTETINGESVNTILPTYKKYIANITQTGVLDPVVTVLENTIGNIVWTRLGVGYYLGTLIGAFPNISKTYCVINQTGGAYGIAYFDVNGIDEVIIRWADFTGTPLDGVLNNNTIEIRVYP
jgi:hypothetical protein